MQCAHAVLDAAEGLAAGFLQAGAGGGQAQAATGPLEQGQAQMVFQQLQLPADRAMGYMQGLCSAANAAQTCGGLECPQGIQRRQQ